MVKASSLFVFLITVYALFLIKDVTCKHNRNTKAAANVTEGEDGKIVGGYNVNIQNYPYQVYILLQKGDEYFMCGGSIISKRYVLTAAHCITGISKAFIRAGSTDSNSGGSIYQSSRLIQHPRYNTRTSDYDVAVIQLSSDMNIDGKNTKMVKLAQGGTSVKPGTELTVTGWGATSENGPTSSTLMAVQVPVESLQDCRESYGSRITTRMLCAGVPQGGKDSCQGDSGGPAVGPNGVQRGIVSFGAGCAREGYPGVYTNVAAVRSWIRQTAKV